MENHAGAELGGLIGGFTTGEAAANDVNGIWEFVRHVSRLSRSKAGFKR